MNPFSYGTIVRGDAFFDRRKETDLLTSTLAGGNNVVLFAPRRYGKTSLVFRVMDRLEEQGIPYRPNVSILLRAIGRTSN